MSTILSVSQINRYVASKIRGDMRLKSISVKGEISNFNQNYNSGHIYFSLKDETSSIRCVMFASRVRSLKYDIENGMTAVVLGSVDVYERDGAYQIIAADIMPAGEGLLSRQLNELKDKLSAKGYFKPENKKTVPELPQKIGVVASITSAALQDIINVISRRFPIVKLCVFNATVQGSAASESIVKALKAADRYGVDTIILARGGGSAEDLNCFNSESVADAVFALNTPCISAVGHETDITICDLVADRRAPTPSAAAEIAVPELYTLYSVLDVYKNRLSAVCFDMMRRKESKVSVLYDKCVLLSPKKQLEMNTQRVISLKSRLYPLIETKLMLRCEKLTSLCASLEALSPLKVLSRGYALVEREGSVISDADSLAKDDIVDITFSKGSRQAQII